MPRSSRCARSSSRTLKAVSPFYMTAPVDAPGPDYLNAVARIETSLEPYGLLLHLLDIELMLGRKRRGLKKNAPRSVDLDLLLVDSLMIQSTPLTVPHPRLHLRAFVLRPLLDLDPDIVIPGLRPGARLPERSRGPAHRAAGHHRRALTPDAVAAGRRADDASPRGFHPLRLTCWPASTATSSSRARSAPARPRWRGGSPSARRRPAAGAAGREPVPRALLPRQRALRAADADVLPVPARAAARAS